MSLRYWLVIALSVVAHAAQADAVSFQFRTPLVVDHSKVTVGDVIRIAGLSGEELRNVSAVSLGQSPAPGQHVLMTREMILTALASADLSRKFEWTGPVRALLGRSGTKLEDAQIVAGAQAQLQQFLSANYQRVAVQPVSMHFNVETGPDEILTYHIAPDASARKRMAVWARISGGQQARSFPVWFSVSAFNEVWVLDEAVPAGHSLEAAARHLEQVDVAALDKPMSASQKEMGGLLSLAAMPAGAVLLMSSVKRPSDVNAGDVVRVELRDQAIMIESRGTALQAADVGQKISVESQASRARYVATVIGPGIVEVAP